MKKVDVYEIIIKTFGLLFLFTGVFRLEYLITTLISLYQIQDMNFDGEFLQSEAFIMTVAILLLISIIYGGLFYIFFIKTSRILKLITKDEDYKIILTPFIDQKAAYKLVLILLGFVLIANAIPNCISLLNERVIAVQSDKPFSPYRLTYLIINVIKTFIGCALVIGADVISMLLTRKSKVQQGS